LHTAGRPVRTPRFTLEGWLDLSLADKATAVLSAIETINRKAAGQYHIIQTIGPDARKGGHEHRGFGVVTLKRFTCGFIFGEYAGHSVDGQVNLDVVYPTGEGDEAPEYIMETDLLKGERLQFICAYDVRVANLTRFINHCGNKKPNVEAFSDGNGKVYIRSIRAIKQGEELLMDYGEVFFLDGTPKVPASPRPTCKVLSAGPLPAADKGVVASLKSSTSSTGMACPGRGEPTLAGGGVGSTSGDGGDPVGSEGRATRTPEQAPGQAAHRDALSQSPGEGNLAVLKERGNRNSSHSSPSVESKKLAGARASQPSSPSPRWADVIGKGPRESKREGRTIRGQGQLPNGVDRTANAKFPRKGKEEL
jgi:hypothetical protein